MKTVNVLFPDSTHGKFAVKPGDRFAQLYGKACTKRELDPEGHELVVNKVPVVMDDVVDAESLAAAVVAVRVRRDGLIRSSLRALAASAADTGATSAPAPPKKQERWCAFCGTVIADESVQVRLCCALFASLDPAQGVWRWALPHPVLQVYSVLWHAQERRQGVFEPTQCVAARVRGVRDAAARGQGVSGERQSKCAHFSSPLLTRELDPQRCGESVRGCFVVTLDKGDVHVECMTCNLCKESLVSTGHVEKDGEMLCTAHRGLKPLKDGPYKRPKKTGAWKSGELCLVRLKSAKGWKWRQGIIVHVKNFVADVRVDDSVLSANVSDLLVTHKAVAVKQTQKELRRGKAVPGDLPSIQRDNSLAQFQRVNLGRKPGGTGVLASSPPPGQKSPRQEPAKSREMDAAADRLLQDSMDSAPAAPIATAAAAAEAEEKNKEEETEETEELLVAQATVPQPGLGLRYADDEKVLFRQDDGEWAPGTIVTGDAEVANGPFYLVTYGDGMEDLVAQRDIRRVPFFRVGDVVEARWTEDNEFYLASVDEVIDRQAHTYLITFLEYGNSQQCTIDFLRPAPDSFKCSCCGGPQEVVDGACFFCGQLDDSEDAQPPKRAARPLDVELPDEDDSSQDPPSVDQDLRATIEALKRENAELRERLNEALRAQQQSAAEAEALRQAGKASRLRHSAAQLAEAEKAEVAAAAAAVAKPLPARPGAGRKPGGLLREPSASQVGAGRGSRK